MQTVNSAKAKPSFWSDFLSGLAGPSANPIPWLVGESQYDITTAVGEGDSELIGKEGSLAMKLHRLNALFEQMRRQIGVADRAAAYCTYHLISEVAPAECLNSASFQKLGTLLSDNDDRDLS